VRSGATIAYAYDALNRMILKDVPGNDAAEFDVTYAYDLAGRRLSATAGNGIVTAYGYDGLGRLASETGAFGTKAMQYDLAGRMSRLTWPDGLAIGYLYLDTGEMREIREAPAGANLLLATFGYDGLGRRTSLARGNGTVTAYAYDGVSRLSQIAHDFAGTASDHSLGFGYNPASQISQNTRSNDAYAFTSLTNLNRADTINGLNQVTATGGTALTHDARGNIQTIGSNYYEYSAENRLAWVWDPDPTALAYDPLGRIHQTAYPATTRYAYAGTQLISELDNANALQRRYVFGPGVDEPLVWYEGAGASDRRWFHADHQGSVLAVSDANGTATINRYDEYGNVQGTLSGPGTPIRLSAAGRGRGRRLPASARPARPPCASLRPGSPPAPPDRPRNPASAPGSARASRPAGRPAPA
jgi:YD repeat-containing protein